MTPEETALGLVIEALRHANVPHMVERWAVVLGVADLWERIRTS